MFYLQVLRVEEKEEWGQGGRKDEKKRPEDLRIEGSSGTCVLSPFDGILIGSQVADAAAKWTLSLERIMEYYLLVTFRHVDDEGKNQCLTSASGYQCEF